MHGRENAKDCERLRKQNNNLRKFPVKTPDLVFVPVGDTPVSDETDHLDFESRKAAIVRC